MALSFPIVFLGSLLFILVGGVGMAKTYTHLRNRYLLSLDWPSKMGYDAFRYRLIPFLRLKGWDVWEPNYTPWPIYASKHGKRLVVISYPSGIHPFKSVITDLDELSHQIHSERFVGATMVALTVDIAPSEICDLAAQRGVRLMEYKQFGRLEFLDDPRRGDIVQGRQVNLET